MIDQSTIWYDKILYDMWVGCATLKESSQRHSCDVHVE